MTQKEKRDLNVYLVANDRTKAMFERKCRVVEDNVQECDVALIIRSASTTPEDVNRVVDVTSGQVPVVVMIGDEDEKGGRFVEEATIAGIPEEYVLKGTEWRVQDVIRMLEEVVRNPQLPDPIIPFDDEEYVPSQEYNPEGYEESIQFQEPEPMAAMPYFAAAHHDFDQENINHNAIAVIGLNGGAGASTVAASLLAYLKKKGYQGSRLIDTSRYGDLSFHFELPNTTGRHPTDYGDVVITHGDLGMIEGELRQNFGMAVVDLNLERPCADLVLRRVSQALLVLTPSQIDYQKLKQVDYLFETHRVMVCINRTDVSKPMRHSYVSLLERELANVPVEQLEEREEVITSMAQGVPAYEHLKEQFDQVFRHIWWEM